MVLLIIRIIIYTITFSKWQVIIPKREKEEEHFLVLTACENMHTDSFAM